MSADDGSRVRRAVEDRLSPGERALVSKYLPVVAVVFLLVAAGGGYVIYTVQTLPETETRSEPAGSWAVEADFDHGATVTNGTSVFPAGERFENRPLYFSRLAPVLEGEYVLTHRGDARAADGTVDLRLVLRATEERDTDNGTETIVHWREVRPLASEELSEHPPNEPYRVDFEADTAALTERIAEIQEELGASPGSTEIAVVAEATAEAEVAEDRFAEERTDRLLISPGSGIYEVESDLEETEPYQATRTVEVPIEPTTRSLYGGPALVVVGLVGLAATALAWRRDLFALGDDERVRLEFDRARSDFDEWISVGTVPEGDDRTVAELESLRDLVDVAIDSDRRVIERPDADPRFVVLDDDVRYVFDPPAAVDPVRPRADPDGGDGDGEPPEPTAASPDAGPGAETAAGDDRDGGSRRTDGSDTDGR